MNNLLNLSVLLPLMGFVMAGVFAAFGEMEASVVAFCFPIACMVILRCAEY